MSTDTLPLRLQFLDISEAEPLMQLLEAENIPYEAVTPQLGFDPFFSARPYEPRFEILIQPSYTPVVRELCETQKVYTGLINTESKLIQSDEELQQTQAHQVPLWLYWVFFALGVIWPVVSIAFGFLLLSRRFIELENKSASSQRVYGLLLIAFATMGFLLGQLYGGNAFLPTISY